MASRSAAKALAEQPRLFGGSAFNLRHTFPEVPQGSTDNLMDYAGGTSLYKPQWDLIHNPELTTGLWDEMEDGASISNLISNDIIDEIKYSNTNGLYKVFVDTKFVKTGIKEIMLGNVPDISTTKVKYNILTNNIFIFSKEYKRENIDKTTDSKISFFVTKESKDPIVIFQLPNDKVDRFIQYLGINDLIISGDKVGIKDGNTVALISSSELKMPKIKINLSIESKTNTQFEVSYHIRCHVKYKYPSSKYHSGNEEYNDSKDFEAIKSNNTEVLLNFGNTLSGGDLIINWKYGELSGTKTVLIRGENPELSDIKIYGSSIGTNNYWFFWKIMTAESSNHQFMDKQTIRGTKEKGKYFPIDENKTYDKNTHISEQVGLPLWGEPSGYGLKQLDSWGDNKKCSIVERWNWKENLQGGMQVLKEKEDVVNLKKTEHANIIKKWNDKHQDEPVSDSLLIISGENAGTTVLSITEGKETFAVTPTGTQRSIYDALLIRLFNGGFYYQILTPVDDDPLKCKPYRVINHINEYNKNYVKDVCNLPN